MGKQLESLLREIMRAAKVAPSKEEAERERRRRMEATIKILKARGKKP